MGDPLRPCIYLAPLWRYGASKTCTQTHTHTHMVRRTDGQNDQSHNLLQFSLRSHLVEIITLVHSAAQIDLEQASFMVLRGEVCLLFGQLGTQQTGDMCFIGVAFLLVEPTACQFACHRKIIYTLHHVNVSTPRQSVPRHNRWLQMILFPSFPYSYSCQKKSCQATTTTTQRAWKICLVEQKMRD